MSTWLAAQIGSSASKMPTLMAVLDAAAGSGRRRRTAAACSGAVGDLARQAEAARRVAVRAGVALHEDAVEDRVLRVVDPVLLGEVLAADAEVARSAPRCAAGPAAARRTSSGTSSPIARMSTGSGMVLMSCS